MVLDVVKAAEVEETEEEVIEEEEEEAEEEAVEEEAGEAAEEEEASEEGDEEEDDDDDDDDDDEEEEEDDEDPVDPLDTLRERCGSMPKCQKFMTDFESCNERVKSKTETEEKCSQELLDYFGCMDNCVANNNLFAKLK